MTVSGGPSGQELSVVPDEVQAIGQYAYNIADTMHQALATAACHEFEIAATAAIDTDVVTTMEAIQAAYAGFGGAILRFTSWRGVFVLLAVVGLALIRGGAPGDARPRAAAVRRAGCGAADRPRVGR